MLLNCRTEGAAWRKHGITRDRVIARNSYIAGGLGRTVGLRRPHDRTDRRRGESADLTSPPRPRAGDFIRTFCRSPLRKIPPAPWNFMAELFDKNKRILRAFLVGVQTAHLSPGEGAELLAELRELVENLHLVIAGSVLVNLRSPSSTFLLGSGKVGEVIEQAKAAGRRRDRHRRDAFAGPAAQLGDGNPAWR